MQFTSNHLTTLWRTVLFALAALCLLTEPAEAQPTLSSNRFLFIVDTSAAAKKSDKSVEPLRQAVFDMIYSGLRGYMTNGDSYGVWICGGGTDTSAGVEVWRNKFAIELAARSALRVKDHGLKGAPSLGAAILDVTRIARSVGDVTVVIITDGSVPIQGSPFDDAINARVALVAPGIKAIKATVNIVLAAQDGEFVAWDVNNPEFLISMPSLPPRKPKPQPIVAAATPQPAPTPAAHPGVTARVAAPKPVAASKPIVITKETVERDRQVTRAMASTADLNPALATNGNATASNTPINTVPLPANLFSNANALATEPAQTNPAVAVSTPPPSTSTARPLPAEEVAAAPATPSVAVQPARSPSVPATSAVEVAPAARTVLGEEPTPSRWIQKLGWAAIGASGLGGVLFLCWYLFRDRRAPSLVSRAAALERLHQPRT